jgi:hypothetical protein
MGTQGKNVQLLVLASAAAAGPGAGVVFQLGPEGRGIAQVTATGGALASFTVQGRLDPAGTYVDLHTANVSLAGGAGSARQEISMVMPDMRLQWSGNAGTITAWLMA